MAALPRWMGVKVGHVTAPRDETHHHQHDQDRDRAVRFASTETHKSMTRSAQGTEAQEEKDSRHSRSRTTSRGQVDARDRSKATDPGQTQQHVYRQAQVPPVLYPQSILRGQVKDAQSSYSPRRTTNTDRSLAIAETSAQQHTPNHSQQVFSSIHSRPFSASQASHRPDLRPLSPSQPTPSSATRKRISIQPAADVLRRLFKEPGPPRRYPNPQSSVAEQQRSFETTMSVPPTATMSIVANSSFDRWVDTSLPTMYRQHDFDQIDHADVQMQAPLRHGDIPHVGRVAKGLWNRPKSAPDAHVRHHQQMRQDISTKGQSPKETDDSTIDAPSHLHDSPYRLPQRRTSADLSFSSGSGGRFHRALDAMKPRRSASGPVRESSSMKVLQQEQQQQRQEQEQEQSERGRSQSQTRGLEKKAEKACETVDDSELQREKRQEQSREMQRAMQQAAQNIISQHQQQLHKIGNTKQQQQQEDESEIASLALEDTISQPQRPQDEVHHQKSPLSVSPQCSTCVGDIRGSLGLYCDDSTRVEREGREHQTSSRPKLIELFGTRAMSSIEEHEAPSSQARESDEHLLGSGDDVSGDESLTSTLSLHHQQSHIQQAHAPQQTLSKQHAKESSSSKETRRGKSRALDVRKLSEALARLAQQWPERLQISMETDEACRPKMASTTKESEHGPKSKSRHERQKEEQSIHKQAEMIEEIDVGSDRGSLEVEDGQENDNSGGMIDEETVIRIDDWRLGVWNTPMKVPFAPSAPTTAPSSCLGRIYGANKHRVHERVADSVDISTETCKIIRSDRRSTLGSSALTSISRRPFSLPLEVTDPIATPLARYLDHDQQQQQLVESRALASSALLNLRESPEKQKPPAEQPSLLQHKQRGSSREIHSEHLQQEPQQHNQQRLKPRRPYHLPPRPNEVLTRVSERPSLLSQESPSTRMGPESSKVPLDTTATSDRDLVKKPEAFGRQDRASRQVWRVDTQSSEEKWNAFVPRQRDAPSNIGPMERDTDLQAKDADLSLSQKETYATKEDDKGKGREASSTSSTCSPTLSGRGSPRLSPQQSRSQLKAMTKSNARTEPPQWSTAGTKHMHTMSDAQVKSLFGDVFLPPPGSSLTFLQPERVIASPPMIHKLEEYEKDPQHMTSASAPRQERVIEPAAPSPPKSIDSLEMRASLLGLSCERAAAAARVARLRERERERIRQSGSENDWSPLIELCRLIDLAPTGQPVAATSIEQTWPPLLSPTSQRTVSAANSPLKRLDRIASRSADCKTAPLMTEEQGRIEGEVKPSREATNCTARWPTATASTVSQPQPPRPPSRPLLPLPALSSSAERARADLCIRQDRDTAAAMSSFEDALAQLSRRVDAQEGETDALKQRIECVSGIRVAYGRTQKLH